MGTQEHLDLEDLFQEEDNPEYEPTQFNLSRFIREEKFVIVGIATVFLIVLFTMSMGVGVYLSNEIHSQSEADPPPPLEAPKKTVILLSFGGLSWNYLQNDSFQPIRTHFDQIASQGVKAQMKSMFPSVSFPNLNTMVTGLYPEFHGIIANEMFDPLLNKSFSMDDSSANDPEWYLADPIWVTLKEYNISSASLFWPGTHCEGRKPNYQESGSDISISDGMKQILQWMDLPESERPPRLVLAYFEGIDTAAHQYGPFSDQVRNVIEEADSALKSLLAGLDVRPQLLENLDLMIVSDHGMVDISPQKVLFLEDFIDIVNDAQVITWGPVTSIRPLFGRTDQIHYQLQDMDHVKVYRRENVPVNYYYNESARIPDIIVEADEGWTISPRVPSSTRLGEHGYNPDLDSMKSVFLARGVSFRTNLLAKDEISNLNLYSLMSWSLDILANPNNGSWVNFLQLLNDKN